MAVDEEQTHQTFSLLSGKMMVLVKDFLRKHFLTMVNTINKILFNTILLSHNSTRALFFPLP